ncbi:MAG TPA: AMP-binding protein [Acidimicrobiales bacterium]|nr:AMP-binding protein [Acidimicrobiales bacterium]
MDLNLATLYEVIADAVGDEAALIHGDRILSWSEIDDRAARLAAAISAAGLGPSSKVAQYLYNCPEYLESCYAGLKVRGVPVNVNYRYLKDELRYLLDNSEAEALFFHGSLAERVAEVRDQLPGLKLLVQVDDGAPLLDGAVLYDDVLAAHQPMARIERSDDDIVMLYTGGTTGMPKGVMYRCGDVYGATLFAIAALAGTSRPQTPEELAELARTLRPKGLSPVHLPAGPLMHGAAIASSIAALLAAGTVVTLTSRHFDADELWKAVQDRRVTRISIVGDPFGRPMADALEEAASAGKPYDVSSLRELDSTGTMFSEPVKERILAHADIKIVDNLASSEAPGMGSTEVTRGSSGQTAKFKLGPFAAVFTEDHRRVEAGSGEVGLLAVSGVVPLGYYKDPEKSARTFPTIEGRRWSVPGDFATVEADGTIALLGRGSVCINTAGEKVFPEEVEEVVKEAPAVEDCLVVGVPDEKYGEAVTAVVSLRAGASAGEDDLRAFVHGRLAGYKCPRRFVIVDAVRRAPNGKADYPWAREVSLRRFSVAHAVEDH